MFSAPLVGTVLRKNLGSASGRLGLLPNKVRGERSAHSTKKKKIKTRGLGPAHISISPFPFTCTCPRGCRQPASVGACAASSAAAASDMLMRPGWLLLSIRFATFTVSPKRQNRGVEVPTTEATTLPQWMPARMATVPISESSSLTATWLAAAHSSSANWATRAVWSADCPSSITLPHTMYASPGGGQPRRFFRHV